jgi:hypothetical protein
MIKLTATAKTVYQLDDLQALQLGTGFKKNLDGSYTSEKNFDTKMELNEFLKNKSKTLAIQIETEKIN